MVANLRTVTPAENVNKLPVNLHTQNEKNTNMASNLQTVTSDSMPSQYITNVLSPVNVQNQSGPLDGKHNSERQDLSVIPNTQQQIRAKPSLAQALLNEEPSRSEPILVDKTAANPSQINSSNKDIQTGKNKEKENTLKLKELRLQEAKLKKWEETLKKEQAEYNESSKDMSQMKAYIIKLEAKVQELENTNRILRMKVTGLDDEARQRELNNREHTSHSALNNPHVSRSHTPNLAEHSLMHTEASLMKERISHIEETRHLHRKIHDIEISQINNRLTEIERSVQMSSFNRQNAFHPHATPYDMMHIWPPPSYHINNQHQNFGVNKIQVPPYFHGVHPSYTQNLRNSGTAYIPPAQLLTGAPLMQKHSNFHKNNQSITTHNFRIDHREKIDSNNLSPRLQQEANGNIIERKTCSASSPELLTNTIKTLEQNVL